MRRSVSHSSTSNLNRKPCINFRLQEPNLSSYTRKSPPHAEDQETRTHERYTELEKDDHFYRTPRDGRCSNFISLLILWRWKERFDSSFDASFHGSFHGSFHSSSGGGGRGGNSNH